MGLIHEPALVFLDEPSTGLDPQSRANLWKHIKRLRDEFGTTVFITTHYMDEADALCDRILIIDNGEIVAEGTPDQLKRRLGGDAVIVTLADPADGAAAAKVAAGAVPGAEPEVDGAYIRLTAHDGGATLPKLLGALAKAKVEVAGVEVRRPTLDDVFLTLTGHTLRDDAA